MYLIQIFLTVFDNTNRKFPHVMYRKVRDELTQRFGGLTAHTRAQA